MAKQYECIGYLNNLCNLNEDDISLYYSDKRPNTITLKDPNEGDGFYYADMLEDKCSKFKNKRMSFAKFYKLVNEQLNSLHKYANQAYKDYDNASFNATDNKRKFFLGRPEYNWLVADGIFKPFDNVSPDNGGILYSNFLPIYETSLNPFNKTWHLFGGMIYYMPTKKYLDYTNDELFSRDEKYGWKVKWRLVSCIPDALFEKYLASFDNLYMSMFSQGRLMPYITTTIYKTQFVNVKDLRKISKQAF